MVVNLVVNVLLYVAVSAVGKREMGVKVTRDRWRSKQGEEGLLISREKNRQLTGLWSG